MFNPQARGKQGEGEGEDQDRSWVVNDEFWLEGMIDTLPGLGGEERC